jgi:hypothetical protein
MPSWHKCALEVQSENNIQNYILKNMLPLIAMNLQIVIRCHKCIDFRANFRFK